MTNAAVEAQRSTAMSVLGAAALVCATLGLAVPSAAVVDRPLSLPPDSLRTVEPPERQGGGMLWMIGSSLLEQGDVQAALPYLNDAWLMSQDAPEVGRTLRDVLMEMGYVADALRVSTAVLELPGAGLEDRRNHVVVLAANGRDPEAYEHVHALQAERPEDLELRRLEGDLLIRQQRWDEAEAVFRDLRDRDTDNMEIHTGVLAELAMMRDDPETARSEWRRGLAVDPRSVKIRSSWIQFELTHSRVDTAFAVAERGDRLGVSPGEEHGEDWTVMTAGLLIGSGRRDEARDHLLTRAVEGGLGVKPTLLLTQLLNDEGQGPRAVRVLRDAIAADPEVAAYHAYLGEHLGDAGDHAAAERHTRTAHDLDPDDPLIVYSLLSTVLQRHPAVMADPRAAEHDSLRTEVVRLVRVAESLDAAPEPFHRMLMGAAMAAMDESAAALPHFEAAVADPRTRRDALLNLSIAYAALDRPDDVVSALEDLVAENPDDATALNALGYSLADNGVQLERAEELIRRALEDEPENAAFLDSLGWVHFRQGRYLEAFDLLVRAANALPEDPEILEHLARVLLALDQPDRSRHVAAQALEAGADPEDVADLLGEGAE